MSTISQWAVYQMCENFDNNYSYILKIVKDLYPELYSKNPIDDSQRKSILGYFHKSFAEFLLLEDDKKIAKEKQKPFQWSKWNDSTNKETVIDLTAEVPTNWDIYNMYQTNNRNCRQVLDKIRNEYPDFVIPENCAEDNLQEEIFINYEKIQSILDNGGEKELNEEKEKPFNWKLIELRSESPDSYQYLMPEITELPDAALVEGDNNDQQISDESSKDKSKSSPSYNELIVEAILSKPDKQLALDDIYFYITKHYPQYKAIDIIWKKLIKRRLHSSRHFVMVHNSKRRTTKGCLWRIASVSESKPASQTLRRRCQKVVLCSTTPNDGCSINAANSYPNNPQDGASSCQASDVGEAVNTTHVDNNGQQITSENSKDNSKPPYTYIQLISQALLSVADKQLTIIKIYSYIENNYPYYKTNNKVWQNTIRHNLSFYPYFVKVPDSEEEPGTECSWKIDPAWESNLIAEAFQNRGTSSLRRTRNSKLSTIAADSNPKSPDSKQNLVSEVKDSVDALYVDLEEPVDAASVEGDNSDQQISSESSKDKSKPSPSYDKLIVEAISSTPNKQMTLNNMYIYISKHYPQYKAINITWKKLVKRKLHSSRQFVKVHNFQNKNSNHCLWRITSVYKSKPRTLNGSCQKSVPCSTSLSNGCSISAADSSPKIPDSKQSLVPEVKESVDALYVDLEEPLDAASVEGDNSDQQISRENSKDKFKPSPSYDKLIVEAISSTPNKQMTLNNMYIYISKHYSQFQAINITWKKLVKRKLHSSRQFVKVHNFPNKNSNHCLWRITSVYKSKPRTLNGSCQKSVPCSTSLSNGCSIRLENLCLNGSSSSPCLMSDLEKPVDTVHVDPGKPVDVASVEDDNTGQQISSESSKDKSKPSPSYDKLIVEAISSTPNKQMTLNNMYIYISKHYPQYKAIYVTWKKLLKENLYHSGQFIKVHNSQGGRGKVCFWRIASVSENNPASRTLKGSCQNTIPSSTTANDECFIKSSAELNSNEMQDSLKDAVAVSENLTDRVSVDHCLSTSSPPPSASLHLNLNTLPVSQVQIPSSTGVQLPPLTPSTEVSRAPLEETAPSTSHPPSIEMLEGGSDASECQNLMSSIRKYESLVRNGMREIMEKDVNIERLKKQINTVSINQRKLRQNLQRLKYKHQQKKMDVH